MLAGIDSEVIMSLLRDALELYTQEEETGRRDGSGKIHSTRQARNIPMLVVETKAVRRKAVVHSHGVCYVWFIVRKL